MAHDVIPSSVTGLPCTDQRSAAMFWENVDRLDRISCDDRVAALRHVALCPACAARVLMSSEEERPSQNDRQV